MRDCTRFVGIASPPQNGRPDAIVCRTAMNEMLYRPLSDGKPRSPAVVGEEAGGAISLIPPAVNLPAGIESREFS